MIGLQSGTVRLAPYTEEWAEIYQDEEKLLWKAIGPYVIDIQHVGSTSILGLASKPIIDIAVGVRTLDIGEKCIKPLIMLGYEYKYDAGIKGRHFFAKGSEMNRTHYLHVEEWNGELWANHILFRDYLRTHPEAIIDYENLKCDLTRKYPNDRDAYTAGKDKFIKTIIEMARKGIVL